MENQNKLTVKDSSLAVVLGFIFAQVSVLVVILAATIFISPFVEPTKINNFFYTNAWGNLICTIALDLGLFGVFLFFNRKKENKIAQKINTKKLALYILITVATFFCLVPIVNCFDTLLTKLNFPLNELDFELNLKGLFPNLLSFVIIPPIFEELLFRGLILKGFKEHGKVFTVLLTSLFFAIFHMAIDQFIYQLLFGILLAIIMYKENNILYTIAMHATNNLLALVFTYFDLSIMISHWAFVVLAVLLMLLYIAIIVFVMFKLKETSPKQKLGTNKYIFIICLAIMIIFWIVLVTVNKIGKV